MRRLNNATLCILVDVDDELEKFKFVVIGLRTSQPKLKQGLTVRRYQELTTNGFFKVTEIVM